MSLLWIERCVLHPCHADWQEPWTKCSVFWNPWQFFTHLLCALANSVWTEFVPKACACVRAICNALSTVAQAFYEKYLRWFVFIVLLWGLSRAVLRLKLETPDVDQRDGCLTRILRTRFQSMDKNSSVVEVKLMVYFHHVHPHFELFFVAHWCSWNRVNIFLSFHHCSLSRSSLGKFCTPLLICPWHSESFWPHDLCPRLDAGL